MRTAVIAATPGELALIIQSMSAEKRETLGLREVYLGQAAGREVVCCVSGMGKINAASAATHIIEAYAPLLVISTGCGGAYSGAGLAIGDLALATTEICGDEGVLTPGGWEGYECIGLPAVERSGRLYYNEFPLSAAAGEKAAHLAAHLDIPLRRGKFVTVSTCSGTTIRGDEIVARFGAVCENMEGAAVAQVALQYGVACMEVRGISNDVDDRDLSRWDLRLAAEQAQRFVLKYLQLPEVA
jgi:futalosine hydrolase